MLTWLTRFHLHPVGRLLWRVYGLCFCFAGAWYFSSSSNLFVQNCAFSVGAACIFYIAFDLIPVLLKSKAENYIFLKRLARLYALAGQFDAALLGKKNLEFKKKDREIDNCLVVVSPKQYTVIYDSVISVGAKGGADILIDKLRIALQMQVDVLLNAHSVFLLSIEDVEVALRALQVVLKHDDKMSIQVWHKIVWEALDNVGNKTQSYNMLRLLIKICKAKFDCRLIVEGCT